MNTITYFIANRTDLEKPWQGTSKGLPDVNAETAEEAIALASKVVEMRGATLQFVMVGERTDEREIIIGNDGREVRVNS